VTARAYVYRSIESVDWDVEAHLEGTVIRKGTETLEGKPRPVLDVESGHQLRRVWQAAGLDDAFAAAEPGMSISIDFIAKIDLGGTPPRTFRKFSVALWRDAGATDGTPKS
jgi:hypothetical protein